MNVGIINGFWSDLGMKPENKTNNQGYLRKNDQNIFNQLQKQLQIIKIKMMKSTFTIAALCLAIQI